MRGERALHSCSHTGQRGSSPHARETPKPRPSRHNPPRYSPACAGNASRWTTCGYRSAVHPRMRGERNHMGQSGVCEAGSSPHARGTLVSRAHPGSIPRFIPACAGNALYCYRGNSYYPVHPRMRGERSLVGGLSGSASGSSPHARGTPLQSV